jgi:hypothetical protein
MLKRRTGIYNLSDDVPESRYLVMSYAVKLFKSINVDPPTSDSASPANPPSSRSVRRGIELKKVSNRRMKKELIAELKYPSYREGLLSILQDKSNSWWNES